MLLTIVFCHSLLRISMLVFWPERRQSRSGRGASRSRTPRYAEPEHPIPITLVRDEEAAIVEDSNENSPEKPVLPPPPVYGVWRDSVVSSTSGSPSCALLIIVRSA